MSAPLPASCPLPAPFRIGPGECHLWDLDLEAPLLPGQEALLDPEEQARAAAFRVPLPRRQFSTTRSALRLLLGAYLAQPPGLLRFCLAPHGKPGLAPPYAEVGLHFNVSHAGQRALIALTADHPVGVDIEAHRPLGEDGAGLAAMICHPRELAAWKALPQAGRLHDFYRIWTGKEALSKALGLGLGLDFRQLELDAPGFPGLPPSQPSLPGGWQLHVLEAPAGYSAALALAAGTRISRHSFHAAAFPAAVPGPATGNRP